MKWLFYLAIIFATLVVLLLLVGLTRPRKHVARGFVILHQPAEQVWNTLANLAEWPQWNPQARAIERLPDQNGHPLWKISGAWGDMPLEVTALQPPSRMQTSVDAGSFRGAWSYEIEPGPEGTRLTVTEEGEVANPLFRGMMIFLDHHATMRGFTTALGHRLGEEVHLEKHP